MIQANIQSLCSATQFAQLEKFSKRLFYYNERVNLISRKDTFDIFGQHIAPSLAYFLLKRFHPKEHVLDIGSGGGLPGIVNAIMFPDTEFLLVDSTRKKVDILKKIIKDLKLSNCIAMWSRVEDLPKEYQHTFDHTTSRAVAPLKTLLEWSQPFLKANGTVEALKGGDLTTELAAVTETTKVYTLPTEYCWNEKMTSVQVVVTYLSRPTGTLS